MNQGGKGGGVSISSRLWDASDSFQRHLAQAGHANVGNELTQRFHVLRLSNAGITSRFKPMFKPMLSFAPFRTRRNSRGCCGLTAGRLRGVSGSAPTQNQSECPPAGSRTGPGLGRGAPGVPDRLSCVSVAHTGRRRSGVLDAHFMSPGFLLRKTSSGLACSYQTPSSPT